LPKITKTHPFIPYYPLKAIKTSFYAKIALKPLKTPILPTFNKGAQATKATPRYKPTQPTLSNPQPPI
jgi:hypothetical protein